MTTATEVEQEVALQQKYTEEEREALFDEYFDACGSNDQATIDRLAKTLPIPPDWAKFILELKGKDFLRENFNITRADEEFGEGWLDEEK